MMNVSMRGTHMEGADLKNAILSGARIFDAGLGKADLSGAYLLHAELKVDPRYTSQCCPVCGHIEKANRNKKTHLFTCKNCGYKSNNDRIGAMNLYRMGINYLEDSQVPDTVTAE